MPQHRKLRPALAVLIAVAMVSHLLAQSAAPPTQPGAQIAPLPIGAKVDLRLKDGEKVTGHLVSQDQTGFTITVGKSKVKSRRTIRFDDVDNVTAQKPRHTPVAAWVIAGAVIAAVVIVVVVIAVERHNE